MQKFIQYITDYYTSLIKCITQAKFQLKDVYADHSNLTKEILRIYISELFHLQKLCRAAVTVNQSFAAFFNEIKNKRFSDKKHNKF